MVSARSSDVSHLERAFLSEVDGVTGGFAWVRIVPALADDHPHDNAD